MVKQFISIWILLVLFSCSSGPDHQSKIKISHWKFQTGNEPEWSTVNFDDSSWPEIEVPSRWEKAGYPDYDGYAWYRANVFLPSSLKNKELAGIIIHLGNVDDRDSTFLNGHLIGSMNRWNDDRRYLLTFDNPAIKWDAENCIAVQVYDYSGGGGIYGCETDIVPIGAIDFVKIDYTTFDAKLTDRNKLSKKIRLTTNGKLDVKGKLKVSLINNKDSAVLLKKEVPVSITTDLPFVYELNAQVPEYTSCTIHYQFSENEQNKSCRASEGVPYILTPPAPEKPRFNGARVYGVRPGSPVIYRIPVTGNRPMKLSVDHLPTGLKFNSEKGIITGSIDNAGEYRVLFQAENDKGTDTCEFKFLVGKQIALTPPMGWNSWNCWGLLVDDQKVRAAAEAFVQQGLADYGWTYINIDDGWQAAQRDTCGNIQGNKKFPDMKKLAGDVHRMGLKIGLYSSPGTLTCGGFLGSLNHEQQDVDSWADWGFDYVKYDWCSYKSVKPDPTLEEMKEPYALVGEWLADQPRDIVYSLCQYGMGDVWKWGAETGGNLWRTTGDITDTWGSMSKIGFSQAGKEDCAQPGNWNDPDMLVVGRLGWGDPRPTHLTPDEQYTHISLWSMLAAPLLIGCDLEHLDDFTKNLLCNSEVIAINQDALGKQAKRISDKNNLQIWVKPLEDGSLAIGLFNLSNQYMEEADLPWEMLAIKGAYTVHDVWRQRDIGVFENQFRIGIPAHGVALLRLIKIDQD